MSVIALRALNESLNFDHELLNGLFQKLPEREAEKILLQTLENISITLSAIQESYFSEEREGLLHALCALRNFSNRVGFTKLARVAADAQLVYETGNNTALAAVIHRLLRVGDQSLQRIWDVDFNHY